ncbi:MAG: sigma-70 family RNA polymerase sigma factor [Deltaproteobacteria bacterium]|nr:sigma-70 family RNA polymerase sigma factor [Deltaproteobacteria bacterium]
MPEVMTKTTWMNLKAKMLNIGEEPEKTLVARATNGDRDAFRILVEKYQSRIYSMVYGIVRSKEDAEDLVQESFVKAYFSLKKFRGDSSFYTWLYRIAYNMTIDFKRKMGRRDGVISDVEDDVALAIQSSGLEQGSSQNPLDVVQRKQTAAMINQALSTLSEEHRVAVTLREIDGLSYSEIADVLGVSKGTVMSRIHYAKKGLQKALAEIAPDDVALKEDS